MFNLNNRSKNTKTNTEKASEFEFVRTLSFVGLGASGSYVLEDSYKEGVFSNPSVKLYKNSSPKIIYFDFSVPRALRTPFTISPSGSLVNTSIDVFQQNLENSEVLAGKKNINSFFTNFTPGCTFTLSNSNYNFDEYNLNSNYIFISMKNNLLVASCIEGLTNAAEQTYDSMSFDDTPIFTLSSSKVIYTDPNKFLLTNRIPSATNSFLSFGLKTNDVLEIFNEKYKIEKIYAKPNGNEELLLVGIDQTTAVTIPTLQLSTTNIINVYKQKTPIIAKSMSPDVVNPCDGPTGSVPAYPPGLRAKLVPLNCKCRFHELVDGLSTCTSMCCYPISEDPVRPPDDFT